MDLALSNLLPASASIVHDARMSDYTSFRLGGACPALVECADAQTLVESVRKLNAHSIDYVVVGQGSNLLISDDGLDCVVLRFCREGEAHLEPLAEERYQISGAALLDELVCASIRASLGDLTFCSGIPGTVGGAIAGNAGAFGHQIGDWVESVRLLDSSGQVETVPADQLGFRYRGSNIGESAAIVLDAILRLVPTPAAGMEQERERILELRRSKHPDWKVTACAGSVFRNIEPSSAAERRQAAGWFLEQAGVMQLAVGQAHLYEKHANIIIADKGASAQDVYRLSELMVKAVEKKFGFSLQREIRLMGSF